MARCQHAHQTLGRLDRGTGNPKSQTERAAHEALGRLGLGPEGRAEADASRPRPRRESPVLHLLHDPATSRPGARSSGRDLRARSGRSAPGTASRLGLLTTAHRCLPHRSEDLIRGQPIAFLLRGKTARDELTLRGTLVGMPTDGFLDEAGNGLPLLQQRLNPLAQCWSNPSGRKQSGLHVVHCNRSARHPSTSGSTPRRSPSPAWDRRTGCARCGR